MPRAILGANSIGLPKSSGISSIQTLSSFCQSVSAPSIFLASVITGAHGCGWPGSTGGVAPAAEAGRAAGAAPAAPGAPGAAATGAPGGTPGLVPGVVAHPAASSTPVTGTTNRRYCTRDLRMERGTSVSRDG